MATPTGLSSQLMLAEESAWGTGVTPTRTYEFRTENLGQDIARVESQGRRSGTRVLRSDRWAAGQKDPKGPVALEVGTKGFGVWFKHMFGSVATTQPNSGTDPTVYDHTFTPGDLTGKGLTVQVGKPDDAGTVQPFTYAGMKVGSWSLGCNIGEIPILTPSLVGASETTATALASPVFTALGPLFTFVQGSVSVGGSSIDARQVTLNGDNGLDIARWVLGSQTRKEPLEANLRNYGGTIDSYFASLTAYNRFVNGTEAALVLAFVGGSISGVYTYSLTITCNIRTDGATPAVGGPGEVRQPLNFKCIASGADSTAITAVYRTTDTTP